MNYSSVILKKTTCIICANTEYKKLFTAKYLFFELEGEYEIVKCCECDLIPTNPIPTLETMNYYYPNNYAPYIDTQKPKSQNFFKKFIKNFINFLFDAKGQSIPKINKGNILDIGCASGDFLYAMKNKGWNVFGIETSADAAKYASNLGLNIYCGAIENAPKPKFDSLDLITAWMAIEHLHNPIFSLKKLHSWSNKNTYLVFSIPNANSFEFNFFKKYWYALQVPTHIHHFTPKSIAKVLDISGWKVERIIYQRSLSNIIGSFGHILETFGYKKISKFFLNYPHNPMKLNYLFYPIALILSFIRESGRITVWAKIK